MVEYWGWEVSAGSNQVNLVSGTNKIQITALKHEIGLSKYPFLDAGLWTRISVATTKLRYAMDYPVSYISIERLSQGIDKNAYPLLDDLLNKVEPLIENQPENSGPLIYPKFHFIKLDWNTTARTYKHVHDEDEDPSDLAVGRLSLESVTLSKSCDLYPNDLIMYAGKYNVGFYIGSVDTYYVPLNASLFLEYWGWVEDNDNNLRIGLSHGDMLVDNASLKSTLDGIMITPIEHFPKGTYTKDEEIFYQMLNRP